MDALEYLLDAKSKGHPRAEEFLKKIGDKFNPAFVDLSARV